MKKKASKIILLSFLGLAGAAVLFVLVARAFFRPKIPYVLCEDTLFRDYEEFFGKTDDSVPFLFVSESDFSLFKDVFFLLSALSLPIFHIFRIFLRLDLRFLLQRIKTRLQTQVLTVRKKRYFFMRFRQKMFFHI